MVILCKIMPETIFRDDEQGEKQCFLCHLDVKY